MNPGTKYQVYRSYRVRRFASTGRIENRPVQQRHPELSPARPLMTRARRPLLILPAVVALALALMVDTRDAGAWGRRRGRSPCECPVPCCPAPAEFGPAPLP